MNFNIGRSECLWRNKTLYSFCLRASRSQKSDSGVLSPQDLWNRLREP